MNKTVGIIFLVVITLFLVLFNAISLSVYFSKNDTTADKAASSDDKATEQAIKSNKNITTNVTSPVKSTSSSKTPSSTKNDTTNKTSNAAKQNQTTPQNITQPTQSPSQKPTPPQSTPSITMFADNYSGTDEEFSISINIDSDTSILAVNYELSFDTSIVELKSIIGGDYLSKNGNSFPYDVINNTSGKVSHFETLYTGKEATGKGTIGIITFKKKQQGKFSLQFTKSQVAIKSYEMLNVTAKSSFIEVK